MVEFFSAAISARVWRSHSLDRALVLISGLSKLGQWMRVSKRESNRLPKKTHGRGQEIRHRDRCLVENPAQHF